MNDKLLRAFIEASGFSIEEVKAPLEEIKLHDGSLTLIPIDSAVTIDYKVTKKKAQVCFDVDSHEWSCIVEYVLSHQGDIEAGTNDFDCLRPMLNYFNRNC